MDGSQCGAARLLLVKAKYLRHRLIFKRSIHKPKEFTDCELTGYLGSTLAQETQMQVGSE